MAANWKYDERQRQIEKERIREEIIAEEIARRRILEEEVRRELMLEKKIPFRPLEPYPTSFGCCCRIPQFLSPDQSRIACKFDHFYESRTGSPSASPPTGGSIGLPELPFQCHPDLVSAAGPSLVSNGIQPQPSQGIAMVARIETNVAGQKRKSPIREADQEGNNVNSTKKPKVWNCMLCNAITTSEIDLNRHKQGRKHKAREAGLIAPDRRCDATAVKKECNSSNVADLCSNGDTPVKAMPSAKSSEKTTLWCDLCQVGTTCPKDMAAHEVGKKHLAKLHKDKDALPKKTRKEVAQNRLESSFIPFEMKETCNANVVVTSRDNGSRVVVGFERDSNTAMVNTCDPSVKMTFRADGKPSENVVGQAKNVNSNGNGDTPGLHTTLPSAKSQEEIMFSSETCRVGAASSSSATKPLHMDKFANGSRVVGFERDAKTSMVSTCDPGVKMTFRADGKPSENVVGQAKDVNVVGQAKDVNSNGYGDTSELKTTLLSAKSQEEIMFSSELCRVLAASSLSPTKPLPMEKTAEGTEAGNALPKELTKEAEKEVMQVEQESDMIPSEAEKTAKNTIDSISRGNANCAPCPLSATSERCLDERKQGRKSKAKEAGLAVQKTVTRKKDALRSKKKASAKSCEKFKLWYQTSQVGTPSAEALHDNKLYDESCALPDVSWFIEEVAQEVKDEDVAPKGAKETGKVALQDQQDIDCAGSSNNLTIKVVLF